MDQVLDLFGNPLRAGAGKPGRPCHVPDEKSTNRIKLGLLMDKTEAELAASIGITEKTLRKHYSRLLKSRDIEKAMAETGITERMLELGMGGNASMMKLAIDRIERERLRKWESRQVLDDKTGEKLGKKEALNRDAKTPTGGWETILGDIPAQDEEKPN